MEPKILENLNKKIYRKFPDFEGIKPKVRLQPTPKSPKGTAVDPNQRNYLLTYNKVDKGPGGQKIPRWVRVVATSHGKIIKISTSK